MLTAKPVQHACRTLQGRQDLEEIAAYMNGKVVAIDLGIWIFEARKHAWYFPCAQSMCALLVRTGSCACLAIAAAHSDLELDDHRRQPRSRSVPSSRSTHSSLKCCSRGCGLLDISACMPYRCVVSQTLVARKPSGIAGAQLATVWYDASGCR